MKFFSAVVLLAVLPFAASANDIKERLQKFRDTSNVDESKLVRFANDRHQRRLAKLEEMLADRHQQLDHHNSGRRRLSAEEHATVTRQVDTFARKLVQMKSSDPEEHQANTNMDEASYFQLNSVDYLDFPDVHA